MKLLRMLMVSQVLALPGMRLAVFSNCRFFKRQSSIIHDPACTYKVCTQKQLNPLRTEVPLFQW